MVVSVAVLCIVRFIDFLQARIYKDIDKSNSSIAVGFVWYWLSHSSYLTSARVQIMRTLDGLGFTQSKFISVSVVPVRRFVADDPTKYWALKSGSLVALMYA
jgi:hypothetical protein